MKFNKAKFFTNNYQQKCMSLLSNKDIEKLIDKEIVIEPFDENCLTPVGYDFIVGDFAYSVDDNQLLDPKPSKKEKTYYIIKPKTTVQLLTKESLWVSKKVAGTFHSKVTLVSQGLSHISTTLDPGWYGPLLITIRNNLKTPYNLDIGKPFVTLVFYEVKTPTEKPHDKPEYRKDILSKRLDKKTNKYLKKMEEILGNAQILANFESKVKEANQNIFEKVKDSIKKSNKIDLINRIFNGILIILLILIPIMNLFWNNLSFIFNYIQYDSKIAGWLTAAWIALFLGLMKRIKK